LGVVHIVDEEVQGPEPLHQALSEPGPFSRIDDAGDDIERPGAVDRRVTFGRSERHTDGSYLVVSRSLTLGQSFGT
jgi:hypothetical protein